jgi:hypothetical protein
MTQKKEEALYHEAYKIKAGVSKQEAAKELLKLHREALNKERQKLKLKEQNLHNQLIETLKPLRKFKDGDKVKHKPSNTIGFVRYIDNPAYITRICQFGIELMYPDKENANKPSNLVNPVGWRLYIKEEELELVEN